MVCMFMTNFKVVASKMIELRPFYVLSVFCIFSIEKIKKIKNLFSKGYFRIMVCTFMTNFKVVA